MAAVHEFLWSQRGKDLPSTLGCKIEAEIEPLGVSRQCGPLYPGDSLPQLASQFVSKDPLGHSCSTSPGKRRIDLGDHHSDLQPAINNDSGSALEL